MAQSSKYFERVFAGFDSGGSKLTWNWFAAIFQLLWYFFKGLWPKLFLYAMALWALGKLSILLVPLCMGSAPLLIFISTNTHIWIIAIVYFGAMANYDYYLHKNKSEPFWPKFPYKKFKIPFWILTIIFLIYAVYTSIVNFTLSMDAETFGKEAKPAAVASFETDGIRFASVPAQWVVYTSPPESFSLAESSGTGGDTSETLGYQAFKGTAFMGFVEEEKEGRKVHKGLVALIVNEPKKDKEYKSVEDKDIIDRAKYLAGVGKESILSKAMSRFISFKPAEIAYQDFAGRRWGCIMNLLAMDILGQKSTTGMTVYWTVADGKAVFLVTEAYASYKDEIKAQAESFLNSFVSNK